MATDKNEFIADNKASITVPIEVIVLSLGESFFQVSIILVDAVETRLSDQKHGDIVALFSDVKPAIFVECFDKGFGGLLEEENVSRMFFQGFLDFLDLLCLI
jgi:hypothetical protein